MQCIRNPLRRFWSYGSKEIIRVRSDRQIVRHDIECGGVGCRIGKIGNIYRNQFSKKVGQVAREDGAQNFFVPISQIEPDQTSSELQAIWRVRVARWEFEPLAGCMDI